MGNSNQQKFTNSPTWTTLNKSPNKQIIQNKQTKAIIEKHFLSFYQAEEAQKQNLIYQWRNNNNNMESIVQILQMCFDDEKKQQTSCNYDFCQGQQQKIKLTIYTQKLNKLYEYNPKIDVTLIEQIRIFKSIIDSLIILTHKFGYFLINKQMIGYNNDKIGKAWINQNFASNFVQFKKNIKTNEEKEKWQKKTIQIIIDTCNLCTTNGGTSKYSKFYDVIHEIQQKKIESFKGVIHLYREKSNEQQIVSEKISNMRLSIDKSQTNNHQKQLKANKQSTINVKSHQNIPHFHEQNGVSSTGINQKLIISNKNNANKKYIYVPVVSVKTIYPVSEPQMSYINAHIRNTYHNPPLIVKRKKVAESFLSERKIRQDINYVDVNNSTQSFMQGKIYYPPSQKIIGIRYQRENCQITPPPNIHKKNLHNILEEDEVRQSQRCQSIKMIDSMILVEHERQYSSSSHKNEDRIVMEESVILRGYIQ